jgi:hypothetical protein
MPRGEQEILVRRGCRNNNWKNECEDGENGGYKFRGKITLLLKIGFEVTK